MSIEISYNQKTDMVRIKTEHNGETDLIIVKRGEIDLITSYQEYGSDTFYTAFCVGNNWNTLRSLTKEQLDTFLKIYEEKYEL